MDSSVNQKPNIRYSKKRNAILELLKSTETHPSAEWLFQQLKPLYPDLSLGTIYRNLTFFQEQGEIKSVGVVNGQERFDACTHSHCHFICQPCGAVIDLHQVTLDETIAQQVETEYGLTMERHELNVYGLCKNCVALSKEQSVVTE